MIYQTPSKSPDLLLHQKLLTCKCENWIISRQLFHNHDHKVRFIFYFSNSEYLIQIHSSLIPTLILEGYSICKLSQKTKVFSKKDNFNCWIQPYLFIMWAYQTENLYCWCKRKSDRKQAMRCFWLSTKLNFSTTKGNIKNIPLSEPRGFLGNLPSICDKLVMGQSILSSQYPYQLTFLDLPFFGN